MNTSGTTDTANEDKKAGGLVFSRESGLIVDHPITLGRDPSERINRVETFYGQAIHGPVGSTGFLRFADTASYESADGERSAAGWAQGVALRYGAGRVVVMGEAAELTAQLGGTEPFGMSLLSRICGRVSALGGRQDCARGPVSLPPAFGNRTTFS